MTIKVTITNSDTRETAFIRVLQHYINSPGADPLPCGPDLHGGQSVETYVHSGQKLEIIELGQLVGDHHE